MDLSKFTGALPSDSQIYGIYQPLLGWKSGIQHARLQQGLETSVQRYLNSVSQRFAPQFAIRSAVADAPAYDLGIASPTAAARQPTIYGLDSLVAQRVAKAVAAGPDSPAAWQEFTTQDFVTQTLKDIQADINTEFLNLMRNQAQLPPLARVARAAPVADNELVLSDILQRESISAGLLVSLNNSLSAERLQGLLSTPARVDPVISGILEFLDPAKSDMTRASLSPIGLVHLFREYFFEFATFLGTPVQHLWLSPGGTVEIIEISTRKTTVERTIEQSFESIQKSEKDTTTADELSDAVKQENATDTKLGVSATSNTDYTAGVVSGSVSVTGSLSLDQQQKQAREQTHKSTQQTQKLSTEIRQSYKSTFKTVTETTDMTSKRYVLQNTSDKLVNYELRRKMRQVGIQLQDYGTQLCWQVYVDDVGDALGLPLFVHLATAPDLSNLKAPEQVPVPAAVVKGDGIALTFHWNGRDDSIHNFMPLCPAVSIVPPAGYLYDHAEVVIQQGPDWLIRAWPDSPYDETIQIEGVSGTTTGHPGFISDVDTGAGGTEPSVNQVLIGVVPGPGGLRDGYSHDFTVQVTPVYKPGKLRLKNVTDTNNANLKAFNEKTKQEYQDALFKTARERIKLASNIQPRDTTDLREEERIVVYRKLVEQLLQIAGITNEDPHVRHVFSEVVESMFDMDSMLYFVAPDWWMPRRQVSSVDALGAVGVADSPPLPFGLGNTDAATFRGADVVGWGGARSYRADDYYITEDSTPAKMGSSLGWLIQLDGDTFRNAFLNAPWVKAVIPLRVGHEWKALDWLSGAQLEGSDGLNALYQETFSGEKATMLADLKAYTNWPDAAMSARYAGLTPAELTILDCIRYLIVKIQEKQLAAQTKIPDPADPTLSYLPTDKVFEHGFDPLVGGFVAEAMAPFEIFDQWIEVLPTDQIVPVEVAYDPKTGLQI
ncbi:MAG: hypothetical protein JO352_21795 [Chloroflexi bacterium]|nr:hypothetical protein [Chloroflexota bacterium]